MSIIFKRLILTRLFLIIFTLFFSTQCNLHIKNNKQKIIANTGSKILQPNNSTKIEIVIPNYEITTGNLEYLESLPRPKFKVIFNLSNNSVYDLSNDINTILDEHWKSAIKFFYEDAFIKPKSLQEGISRDKAWSVYCERTSKKLQELYFNHLNESRKISQNEAEQFYGDLNITAAKVIEQTKAYNP